ncbi:MAG: glycosyltransferase family 9 protein [Rickettsiales bacterium]
MKILVIKHGAFGDLILASGAIKAIRAKFPDARITLLTTKPFARLMDACPWIDDIEVDERSWAPVAILKILHFFATGHFDYVFDLQTSQRSSFYWWLTLFKKPGWSGIARHASHRHDTPHRTTLHTLDRLKEQLVIAGVLTENDALSPDISWMRADISRFPIRTPYALIVPGGSAHRPEKRWPVERYIELVEWLNSQNMHPVLIGGEGERDVLNAIDEKVVCLNLCGQTTFEEIAELARGAAMGIGNDTGPTHLIAAAGCPTVVLFATKASNPDLCAPRGKHVAIVDVQDLFYLPLQDVIHAAKNIAIP